MAVKRTVRGKKSAARTTRTARATPVAHAEKPVGESPATAVPSEAAPLEARSRWGWAKMVGAGAACVTVAVVAGLVMFTGGDSGERAEAAAVAAQPDSPAVQPQAKPIRAIAGVPRKKMPPRARAAEAPGAPVAPRTASEVPDAAVIEGCLEQAGQSFRLKDTRGEDAPKARSWKSGFLKKGTRPVDVVDWNDRLKDHVGERITVSGMFVDGEMHVRTLRRVAASCN